MKFHAPSFTPARKFTDGRTNPAARDRFSYNNQTTGDTMMPAKPDDSASLADVTQGCVCARGGRCVERGNADYYHPPADLPPSEAMQTSSSVTHIPISRLHRTHMILYVAHLYAHVSMRIYCVSHASSRAHRSSHACVRVRPSPAIAAGGSAAPARPPPAADCHRRPWCAARMAPSVNGGRRPRDGGRPPRPATQA